MKGGGLPLQDLLDTISTGINLGKSVLEANSVKETNVDRVYEKAIDYLGTNATDPDAPENIRLDAQEKIVDVVDAATDHAENYEENNRAFALKIIGTVLPVAYFCFINFCPGVKEIKLLH